MAPLRVLIRARSSRDAANYRELLTNGGDFVVVNDPAGADVVLQILGGGAEDPDGLPNGGPPLLALVGEETHPPVAAALERRGASVLSDGVSRAQLLAALRAVASGLTVRDPSGSLRPLRAAISPGAEEGLTPRERDLLRLLGEGMGNREIAQALGVSDHTVKFHLHSIYTKLGARTRTEAVSVAVRRGLLML